MNKKKKIMKNRKKCKTSIKIQRKQSEQRGLIMNIMSKKEFFSPCFSM